MSATVKININTGNAAFEDQPGNEVARILRNLADAFEQEFAGEATLEGGDFRLMDANGNCTGQCVVEAD